MRQGNMELLFKGLLLVLCFHWGYLADADQDDCEIDLECEECLPEHVPLLSSRALNGSVTRVRMRGGGALRASCGAGAFLRYPLAARLDLVCEEGRFRVQHDNKLRTFMQLGCQESVFEDVLHDVSHCAPPLQGRVYRVREGGGEAGGGGGGVRHVAALCFDSDAGAARFVLTSSAPLPLPPHAERGAPLSLLGNLEHMFDARTRHDAERLFADEATLNKRLRHAFRPEKFAFAEQSLTSAPLIAPEYLEPRLARAAGLVSNRVAMWRSVAAANWRHLQADVGALLRRAAALGVRLDVAAGTHDVLALGAGAGRRALYLKEGRRFPVPRYVWALVSAPTLRRAVAVVVLNDPFVAVSEIRGAVFCDSRCAEVEWLQELVRHRNFERPVNGLAFCCRARELAAAAPAAAPLLDGDPDLLTRLP